MSHVTESVDELPAGDTAFHVEQHGIDFIAEHERWATPRTIGAMWAGSALNVEYFVYGAILMGFGFSFWTAMSLIVLGNLSFFLLGVASLQGQETGTTAFSITRAPFGVRGARVMSFFNWLTQLGFETEGLILIVGAVIVLCEMGGIRVSNLEKVVFVILAVVVQAVLPYFGHATMVKVLRALILPFAAIFVILGIFAVRHGTTHVAVYASGWEIYMAGLAFVIALSGLGWTECGNDYTRYLPRNANPRSVVGWIFLGTAVPEIVIMTLGALTFTFLSTSSVWNGSNPFEAFRHQLVIPSALVVVFLLCAIVQLFGINSLDLYSSGVSLQAMGLRLKRYQAVVLDSILAGGLTIWATLGSTFSLYMKEFVGVIIVWISPWLGIFLTDWLLRRRRYHPGELQRTDPKGLYFGGTSGVNWNAVVAFVMGLVASTMAFSKAPPPSNFPFHWMTPISNHYGAFYCDGSSSAHCGVAGWFGGADFSIFLGMGVGAGVYVILEKLTGYVARQVATQRELEPDLYSA